MGLVTFENQVYDDSSFPATEKVYDKEPYSDTFLAQVVTCHATTNPKNGSRCFAVLLDRTLFFPEQGGQTCDRGSLELALMDEGTSFADLPDGDEGETAAVNVLHVGIDEKTGVISTSPTVSRTCRTTRGSTSSRDLFIQDSAAIMWAFTSRTTS